MNAYQVPADPTAVIGRRIVAFIVNSVILGGAFFLGSTLADLKSEDVPEALQDQDVCDQLTESDTVSVCFEVGDTIYYSESDAAAVTVWLPAVGVVLLNHILLAGATGASVGKHLVGLRTVKKDTGQIAKFGPAIIRTLLWIVDYFPYCFPLVGLITGLTTKGHRRVGDMAAGTLVVDKKYVGTPPVVPGLTVPVGAAVGAAAGYPPPEGAWSAPPQAPSGWGTPAPPPPPEAAWGAPAPAPEAPPAPDAWGAPAPAPEAPPAPDAWAAPAPTDATSSFEAPGYQAPAYEPPAWEPPTYEQPASEPEAAPEPEPMGAPAPEPEPPAAPEPEPEPEPVAAPAPAPTPEPAPQATAEPAAAGGEATGTPGVGAPMWDPARNAYIQWDPSVGAWMQWDDAAQQWRPIS